MPRGIARKMVFGLVGLIAFGTLAWSQGTVTLVFSNMDPHLGKRFELRVVDKQTGRELERISVAEIPVAEFELSFTAAEKGAGYQIDFYVDRNGNGRYDPPPADHAWRLATDAVSGDITLGFTHNTDFTDIAWPPAIDGVVAPEEYRHALSDPATGIVVNWQNDATYLYVGLVSPGTGWVAIGLDPEQGMKGADIIIGAVKDGALSIKDHFGTATTGHREDSASQIVQAAGTEADGKTVIEFVIPLRSDDPSDKSLQSGQTIPVILAYHASSDDFATKHTKRSTTQITLD